MARQRVTAAMLEDRRSMVADRLGCPVVIDAAYGGYRLWTSSTVRHTHETELSQDRTSARGLYDLMGAILTATSVANAPKCSVCRRNLHHYDRAPQNAVFPVCTDCQRDAAPRCACGTPLLYSDETERGTCPECHHKGIKPRCWRCEEPHDGPNYCDSCEHLHP